MKKLVVLTLSLGLIELVGLVDIFAVEKAKSKNVDKKSDKNRSESGKKQTVQEVNNFEEALIYAFNNNQEWFANRVDKEIARVRAVQSERNLLPSLTATFGSSRTLGEETSDYTYPDSDIHTRTKGDSYSSRHNFSLNLRMNVFAGWQTINTMKMRTNEDKAAFHSLKAKGAKLIVDVLDAYSDVWKYRQIVAASKKMEKNLKKILDSQRIKLESGISTPSEVAAAEANYQSAVYSRISSETELLSAEAKFERITGAQLNKKAYLPDLHIVIPKHLDQLISVSLAANHNILESRFNERAALDALNVARGKLAPSVDATLQVGRNISYTDNRRQRAKESSYTANQYVGALEMTVPIFANSGNDYSEIAIAEQNAKKAQLMANNTVLSIKEQCVVNWNTYKSTDAMIIASRTSVESAQLSSESYQEESELGIKSNTEVWDQENKLQESKIKFADSKKRKLLAAINISYLMGELELNQLLKKQIKEDATEKSNQKKKKV